MTYPELRILPPTGTDERQHAAWYYWCQKAHRLMYAMDVVRDAKWEDLPAALDALEHAHFMHDGAVSQMIDACHLARQEEDARKSAA